MLSTSSFTHRWNIAPEDCRKVWAETIDEAKAQAERVDKERVGYIRRYFGENWFEPALYDLMLDSSIGDDAVAAVVALRRPRQNGREIVRGQPAIPARAINPGSSPLPS